MLQKTAKIIIFILALALTSCAKRGSITGGLKDTLAPVLKSSVPKNFSTQFKSDKIRLTFDEYVKLKNLNKQLVISPPLKSEPIITPSTASKFIDIKILDTLKPNTTYSFNFGQSVADNNEGNAYNQFKYVFSTGDYIDSLALGGKIKDAYDKEVTNFVSVMLYEYNENYNDSLIYKENPRYVTNTLDSLKTFLIDNVKAGQYMLVALKDLNNNNKFNPLTEKIGFIKHPITIPNDTVYELELFQEKPVFKAYKPMQVAHNRLVMGYDGKQNFKANKPKIKVTNNAQQLETIITQFPKKDSLQIWFKPLALDSLQIAVEKDNFKKDFVTKIRKQKKDTLNITSLQNGNIEFKERFTLESSTPLVQFDSTKIKLVDKDSVAVPYTTEYDEFHQQLFLDFKREPSQKYNVSILPGALTDFFDSKNDTLQYQLSTRTLEEYGNLKIVLKNVKHFPVIVELTNEKGDQTLLSAYSEGDTDLEFKLLAPTVFYMRAIYDENKNKEYDPGSFLEKRYSEEVIYYSKPVDVRANWDVEQVFDLSIPYTPEVKEKPKKKKEDEKAKENKKRRNSSIF